MTTARPPSPSAAWAYFLDVDGTLLELARTPQAVHVGQEIVELIRALHAATGGAVALVSGRSLADLDQRFGLGQLPAAGQHGLEVRDASGDIRRHAAGPAPTSRVTEGLAPLLVQETGLLIEDKGSTVAVHYRTAPQLGVALRARLQLIVDCMDGFELQPGKLVLEIKPVGHDKGSAVGEFMATAPFRDRIPVFIGDDLTDEKAFAVVNRLNGLSVKVGPGRSCASYRLSDVPAVRRWLGQLAGIPAERKEGS